MGPEGCFLEPKHFYFYNVRYLRVDQCLLMCLGKLGCSSAAFMVPLQTSQVLQLYLQLKVSVWK